MSDRTYHSRLMHIAAPLWLRIPEKHRWRIVGWLDKSRELCWCDLVDAAMVVKHRDPCNVSLPLVDGRATRCKSVCDYFSPDHAGEHDCACYCGKFRLAAAEGAIDRKWAT